MFKKNNKSILSPALQSFQLPIRNISKPTAKAPAITKQLLAKFENKYTTANKLKSPNLLDSDVSDSEESAAQGTVDVKSKPTDDDVDGEAVYESDFETSDSDVSENEKSTVLSQAHFEDVQSNPPESIEEISDEPIRENILTFEDLLKNKKHSVGDFAQINLILGNEQKDSENKIEEVFSNDDVKKDCETEQEKPAIRQAKTNTPKFITESVIFNENIVSFNKLLANKTSPITVSKKKVRLDNSETSCKDSKISTEIEREQELVSTKYDVEDCLSLLVQSNVGANSAKQINDTKEEEVLNENISSPIKEVSSSPPANPTREKDQRTKTKSRRRCNRQALEERRRLERMFFLVEKQSLQGAVEQPVFSPLVMSWEREAEDVGKVSESILDTPEDAFAEMLRLRLRLTRNKMAAEYAAYRSCCTATQILASSHQPVTLAATRQIISQLKQPDDSRADAR